MHTIFIDRRFSGPPGMANGGIASGRLAAYVAGPVQVRLERPIPLGSTLEVQSVDDTVRLIHGEDVLAEAAPAKAPAAARQPLSLAAAESLPFVDASVNPFPECFVCGHRRSDGLALRMRRSSEGRIAAIWNPRRIVDPGKAIPKEYIWAALDCPSGFAALAGVGAGVLGTIGVGGSSEVVCDGPLVVTAEHVSSRGRRHESRAALCDAEGAPLVNAEATWIALAREVVA